MDFMTKIPSYLKLYGLNEKLLLKKVFKDLLPADIVRRPKNPYRAPIRQGLISQNNSLIEKYCTAEDLERADIFNSKMVDKLFTKARNSEALSEIDSMAVAGIISTQIIYDKFIRNFNKIENNNFRFDVVFDKRKIFGVN
jgi:asparagine synthase (glutamine-hydrolysing)